MPKYLKLSDFLPEYLRAFEIVIKKGFLHVQYQDVRDCATDRMRFYRLRNAILNAPDAPKHLKEFAPYMIINWRKGGTSFEISDVRTKKSYVKGLKQSNDDADNGIIHDELGGVLDEEILNYPLNPDEDEGKGFLNE